MHHEVELVLRISKEGKNIEEKFASKYYDAIGIGIDFTARDVQAKLKGKGTSVGTWRKVLTDQLLFPASSYLSLSLRT